MTDPIKRPTEAIVTAMHRKWLSELSARCAGSDRASRASLGGDVDAVTVAFEAGLITRKYADELVASLPGKALPELIAALRHRARRAADAHRAPSNLPALDRGY